MRVHSLLTVAPALTIAVASSCLCAVAQTPNASIEMRGTDQRKVLRVADRFLLKEDFARLFAMRTNSPEQLQKPLPIVLAESQLLKKLWLVQFQLSRLAAQAEEEHSILLDAIERIENRKIKRASTINTVNFLSSSVIALVGNAIFIPAPPPRPTAPNIIFTVSGGLSTGLSLLSLAALRGGKEKIELASTPILAPLFDQTTAPGHSLLVWHYLNSRNCDDELQTPNERFLVKWSAAKELKQPAIRQELLSQKPSRPLTIDELKLRLKMVDEINLMLVPPSKDLSLLAHALL